MDLAPFSAETFDPKDWINNVFKGQEKKDQHASSLVMRLQLAIQEVNSSLEDTSQQVLSSLPRVLRDVESLQHEASLLKTQMSTLNADVNKVSVREGSSSLDTLVQLDGVKSRLTQSATALRQADNWTTLATEVEEVLEAGELEAAAGKVAALQRCLSVLRHSADSEDRAALLNSFQLRIEAMASPHLVEAFTHNNLNDSIAYSRVLSLVCGGGQVKGYYHQCVLARLASAWQATINRDDATPLVCVTTYLTHLANTIHGEVGWVGSVLPEEEPRVILQHLAIAALTDVEPPLHQVVSRGTKVHEEPLLLLADVRQAMDNCIRELSATLHISSDAEDSSLALSRAVYRPLAEQLSLYAGYEATHLIQHLNTADVSRSDVSECMLRLREYCGKMRQQCQLAADRCHKITGMAACGGLVEGCTRYVQACVRLLCSTRQAVAALHQHIREDWTVFTTCLDLIHTAGVVLLSVEECDDCICAAITSASTSMSPRLLLDGPALEQWTQLVAKAKDGPLLEAALSGVQSECSACATAALSTIAAPLTAHLAPLPHLPVWAAPGAGSQLSQALSPQEYVTQMGQYLLTLPQHLEPLLASPSPALNRALQQLDDSSPGERIVSESEVSAADFLIGRVARTTCHLYAEAVLNIPSLSRHAQPQLVTDIEYILNILEDLGCGNSHPLDELVKLFAAPPHEYAAVSEAVTRLPVKMIAAVRQIRDISAQT